jgi:hypothetical protein
MRYKKKLLLVLSTLLLIAFAGSVFAGTMESRKVAKDMIKRTAFVIRIAHKEVNEHHVYTGDLARAIAHQKFAKQLFHDGEYLRAMHQTKRARRLAAKAIKANRGEVPSQADLTAEELSVTANGPSEEQLAGELHVAMPAEPMQDDAVVKLKIDVDLK